MTNDVTTAAVYCPHNGSYALCTECVNKFIDHPNDDASR